MKLVSAHVRNFRSVEDSEEFSIGNLTCLVGKNEAGKTALLTALYGLNSYGPFSFDKIRDYPRRFLNKYDERNPDGESKVIETTWELDDHDVEVVSKVFGEKCLTSRKIKIHRGFGYSQKIWTVPVNAQECLNFFIHKSSLDETEYGVVRFSQNAKQAVEAIEGIGQRSERLDGLYKALKAVRDTDFGLGVIDVLSERLPKLFLTSHFDRMAGEVSVNAIKQAIANNNVSPSDRIFIDFLAYAGTSVDELMSSTKLEELKAKCEGASNEITDEIFEFWSQNDALKVDIDIAEGRGDDPAPFNSGTVVKARVYNYHHRVSVPLSERSAGFIWFFSFLAQFKQLRKQAGNAIILLDEPGLTLHGKAQADLLRFIEKRLLPGHQVIYTTHSPFMVPSDRLSDVLIVEDVVKTDGRGKTVVEGTKVRSDVLLVGKDTLFPLQGALGYDITQSLFVGKNNLLVEGPSDILYLQALSSALQSRGKKGLDPRWTMCPSGGIDRIASFASLFGANRLNMAVLCDMGKGDKTKVEKLRRHQLLQADHVFTVNEFTGQEEGDVEDLFSPQKYADLLNASYGLTGENAMSPERFAKADEQTSRVVKQAEAAFRVLPSEFAEFDHFTPSAWLIRNLSFLDSDDADTKQILERAETLFGKFNDLLSKD